MTLDEAIKHFGSGWRMCQELGLKSQNFTYWKKKNRIPLVQQLIIERMTDGLLEADASPKVQK